MERLRRLLQRLDGRGYGAYKDLRGETFRFPAFTLHMDHIQGDPFAAPSRFRIRIPWEHTGLPSWSRTPNVREVALRDWVLRRLHGTARRFALHEGSGKSGWLGVDPPGQEILERSGCVLDGDVLEIRFFVGLPARGRRILGRVAETLLIQHLPRWVEEAVMFRPSLSSDLRTHVEVYEDHRFLQSLLLDRGWIAFVADGSILPRRSGVEDVPLPSPPAVPWTSPPELTVTVTLPNAGEVRGTAFPRGVILIVGGGFHGKSTLLRALERGVYAHIPGDGRERVATDPTAVKIRAEDGRRVAGVALSPFIADLPGGISTRNFSTQNASGSTSQAANILEALEAGARVLLLDEDTSATNFMIRDRRMQALIARDREPITPFVDRVRELYETFGVSTVLVMGGSGDYLDVADRVVAMDAYHPRDVTRVAREVVARFPTGRLREVPAPMKEIRERIPLPGSLDFRKGRREVYLKARGVHTLQLGTQVVDLRAVEQIVEDGQVRAIADALLWLSRNRMREGVTLRELLRTVEALLDREGLDALAPRAADRVRFRGVDLAAALNRLRTLRVRFKDDHAG